MQNRRQYPEPLEALIIILSIFAFLIISIYVLSALNNGDLSSPETIISNSRYFFIFGGSLFLIVPLAYAWIRKFPIRPLFRFNPVPAEVLLLGIPIGLSLAVLGDELDRLIGLIITVPDWIYEMMYPLKAETSSEWLLIILGAVVVASVAEETLFRGFLQTALERKGDATRAVLFSSLAWTLVHQNPYWAVGIFVLGVVIGYLAWRTDSIILPVLVHAINNLLSVMVLNTDNLSDKMGWYEWNGHVAPVVLVIAAGVLYWSLRRLHLFYQTK